jgi:hypothetical protein
LAQLARALSRLFKALESQLKVSALIHLATRYLKINVGLTITLCDYQVVGVSEVANFTGLAWFARDERSPTTAELRGKVAIRV